jgi:hypothetical protein
MTETQHKEHWNVAAVSGLYTSVETWILDLIRGDWEIVEGDIRLGSEYTFTFADNEIRGEQVIGDGFFVLAVERDNNPGLPVYPGLSRITLERPLITLDGHEFSNDERGTVGSLEELVDDYGSVDELLFESECGPVLTATIVECCLRNEKH